MKNHLINCQGSFVYILPLAICLYLFFNQAGAANLEANLRDQAEAVVKQIVGMFTTRQQLQRRKCY